MAYMSKTKRRRVMRQRMLGLAIFVAALIGALLIIWQIGLGKTIATVNDMPIKSGVTKGVMTFLDYMQTGEFSSDGIDELEEEEKLEALDMALIQSNSLLENIHIPYEVIKQYLKAEGKAYPDDEAKANIDKTIDSIYKKSETVRLLRSHGVKKSHVKYYYDYTAAMEALRELSAEKNPVTDEDAQEYYDENSSWFITPWSMQASHILLQDPEHTDERRAEIEEILEMLNDGGDFAELAMEYSEDGSAESGGDLGSFGPGSMVQPFEEACLELAPGEISGIVETQFGFHIIKMIEKTDEVVSPLEDERERIDSILSSDRSAELLDELVEAAEIVYIGLLLNPTTEKPPVTLDELKEARGIVDDEEEDGDDEAADDDGLAIDIDPDGGDIDLGELDLSDLGLEFDEDGFLITPDEGGEDIDGDDQGEDIDGADIDEGEDAND